MNKFYYSIVALIIGCSSVDSPKRDITIPFENKNILENQKPKTLDSYFPPLNQFPAGWTQQSYHCDLSLRVLPLNYHLLRECFKVYNGPDDQFLSILVDIWKEEDADNQLDEAVNYYLHFFPELRKVFLRTSSTLFMVQQETNDTQERINNIVDYMLNNADDLIEINRNF